MKPYYLGRQGFRTTCHYCWEQTNCEVYQLKHLLDIKCEHCRKLLGRTGKFDWPKFRPINRV